MEKLPEIKAGDIITYNDGSQRQVSFTENIVNIDKIVKIERPDYKTIYEKKDILDKEEKEYLGAIIKPFRNTARVCGIKKGECRNGELAFITILIESEINGNIHLPVFDSKKMYLGMEVNREYTLEELGL